MTNLLSSSCRTCNAIRIFLVSLVVLGALYAIFPSIFRQGQGFDTFNAAVLFVFAIAVVAFLRKLVEFFETKVNRTDGKDS